MSRLQNGYVDLTSPPSPSSQTGRRKRSSASAGPSSKRQKQDGDTHVDEVDLTDDTAAAAALQKQREDAVKAQRERAEARTTFNNFTCVICLDTPTDLTATACGHLFCHTCLMEALIASENRGAPGEPRRSQCPSCRKEIKRNKTGDVMPLLLKKGLATQPRGRPKA